MKLVIFGFLFVGGLAHSNEQDCYKVMYTPGEKPRQEVGTLCFSEAPQSIVIGGSVHVEATFGEHYPPISQNFVRLENIKDTACGHPKDRPPVCRDFYWMKFILPGADPRQINSITLSLPDLTHGETWAVYELEK